MGTATELGDAVAGDLRFNMAQAVTALSSSLDLAGQAHSHHMRRVAVMGLAIAHAMGWPGEAQRDALYAGLLHDCGAMSEAEHDELMGDIAPEATVSHCRRGAAFLSGCLPLDRFAPVVAHHHTPWQELRHLPLDRHTQMLANLVLLADRADAIHLRTIADGKPEREAVGRALAPLAGSMFHPHLAECFRDLAQTEAFWLRLLPEYVEIVHYDFDLPPDHSHADDMAAARSLARLFGRIVDAGSSFTGEHSLGVGRVAARLAELVGLDDETGEQLEIAGLLHDIGKLRVPKAIIDKPGAFTDDERRVMRRHSYDTFRILAPVFVESRIPRWAALHHERLSGTGYPFGLDGEDLDLGARIIAVADVLQALAQNRPYRPPLAPAAILAEMGTMAAEAHLDPALVACVGEDFSTLYALATGR